MEDCCWYKFFLLQVNLPAAMAGV